MANAVEELKQVLTLDQAEQFMDFDSSLAVEAASSTQQLLDELLGRFEDDGSSMPSPHGLTPEFYAYLDE
jgi:hypothetical protein